MAGYGEPFKETEIGELPESWQVVRFSETVSIAEGQVDPRVPPYASMLHIGPENIESGTGRLLECKQAQDLGLISGKYLFGPDDVVYSKIRPYLRKSVFVNFAGLCSADMYPLTARDGFEPRYVHYFILGEAFTRQAVSQQDRTGIPKLNREQLNRVVIPKPSVAEQRAIVAVLSRIGAAAQVQGKVVATLKQLKAATMATLFREGLEAEKAERQDTRFGEVPAAWDTVPLGQVAHIQTGVAKGRKLRGESSIVEVPYLRVANVQDGFLDLAEIKTIELLGSEVGRYSLKVGDVLLTEGGDFDKLGRGHVWSGQIAGCVHQNHIFAVRTDRARLLPDFFAYLAQSHYGKAYFLTVAHKTTNLASINSSKLKAFPVLLPTLEEQTGIAAALGRIDDALGVQMGRLDGLKSLFAAMLRLLMSGQVRVSHGIHVNACALGDVREGREMLGEKQQAKDVERFVAELVRRFEPERVILFAPSVPGSPKATGAVGLLVVMPFEGRPLAQAVHIERELKPDFPLDLMVRRPEDVSRALAIGDAFIKGVVERGRTLYVRPGVEVSDSTAVTPQADARRVAPRQAMSEETLREIVRRIVEAVAPEKIILFGSAARGEMGPDSDVDLLVVKSGVDRQETARKIRRSLLGIGIAKDVIVVTPDDLTRCGHDRDSVISSALAGGKVVYAA